MELTRFSPDQFEDSQTQALLQDVRTYIETHQETIQSYTAEEYFLLLLEHGLETRERGNYGIAAALVMRHEGTETVVFGENSVLSESNPHGHAEMNVMRNVMKLLHDPTGVNFRQLAESGEVIVRSAPSMDEDRFLITSLEPCPMCTVGSVINADVGKVIIGTEDDFAGALIGTRLEQLAPLWPDTAHKQELEVVVAQTEDPSLVDTFIPSELKGYLNRLFFETKTRLDEKLDVEGFINLSMLSLIAQGQ